jgi:hypothetical protein
MKIKSIQLHRSNEALELINSDVFVKQWRHLSTELPDHCKMQEAEMLCIWYRHYSVVFEPVIFTAFNVSNELVSFLGMVWDKKAQELRHAGHPQYHGWLAKPDYEIPFLREVFRLIRDQFPIQKLSWSVLSPGLSIDVLRSALSSGMNITYEETSSPMWNIKDPRRLKKLLKNKNIKTSFNKYKRRGNFRFEVIKEPEKLRKVLHIAKNQIDFRKEAINNVLPFKSDPIKIEFYCEQVTLPGTMLPFALWLDDQLLSFNMGVVSNNYFEGRVTSFDPSEFRNSPGTIMLIKLSEYLTENGFEIFDLSPGTSSYKDRFADSNVKLFKPTIHFSKTNFQKTLLKKRIIKGSRNLLIDKFGINITKTRKWETNLRELPNKLKGISLLKILKNISEGIGSSFNSSNLIHLDRSSIKPESLDLSRRVKIQNYEDLLKYSGTHPFLNRRGLLIDAMSKFAKGEILYSVADDENLFWYVWRKKVKGEIKMKNDSISIEEDGFLFYDFYQVKILKEQPINNISQIIPLLDLSDVEHIYFFEKNDFLKE